MEWIVEGYGRLGADVEPCAKSMRQMRKGRIRMPDAPFALVLRKVDYFLPDLYLELTFWPAWSRMPLASAAYGPVGARSRYFW